jgi:hypothetical protein
MQPESVVVSLKSLDTELFCTTMPKSNCRLAPL